MCHFGHKFLSIILSSSLLITCFHANSLNAGFLAPPGTREINNSLIVNQKINVPLNYKKSFVKKLKKEISILFRSLDTMLDKKLNIILMFSTIISFILSPYNELLRFISLVILIPTSEELYFRKYLNITYKKEGLSSSKSAIKSSFVFSLTHKPPGAQFFLGGFLAKCYERTSRISFPIVMHSLNNFMVFWGTNIQNFHYIAWMYIGLIYLSGVFFNINYIITMIKEKKNLRNENQDLMFLKKQEMFILTSS